MQRPTQTRGNFEAPLDANESGDTTTHHPIKNVEQHGSRAGLSEGFPIKGELHRLQKMNELHAIRGFLEINERLGTSGMPQPADFAAIRRAGYATVINVAMPSSDNAMPNEGDLVTRAGMTYVHIPVNFESPRPADFECFAKVMDGFCEQRVFVHCAANMRVSAFLFLYRVLRGKDSRADAEKDLRRIWEPEGVWRDLINSQLEQSGHPPLGSNS